MSYTPTYKRPYEQWKELPSKETLVTAEVLTQYDDTFENIEEYLESEGKKEYALVTEAGYSIVANIDEYYVLTVVLKNKAGDVLSTSEPIDLPIESMIINVDYDEESGILTFSLQNGQTLDVNISTLVRGLVPTSRTIAGVDLEDDITTDELKTVLNIISLENDVEDLKTRIDEGLKEIEIPEEQLRIGGIANNTGADNNASILINIIPYLNSFYQIITCDEGYGYRIYAYNVDGSYNGYLIDGMKLSKEPAGYDYFTDLTDLNQVRIKYPNYLFKLSMYKLDNSEATLDMINHLHVFSNILEKSDYVSESELDDVKSSIASVSDEVDAVNTKLGKIKYIELSNPDNSVKDHIGYIKSIWETLELGTLYVGVVKSQTFNTCLIQKYEYSHLYGSILTFGYGTEGLSVVRCVNGEWIDESISAISTKNLFDGNYKFITLDKSSETYSTANAQSALQSALDTYGGGYIFIHMKFANSLVVDYIGSATNRLYAIFDEIGYTVSQPRIFKLANGTWSVSKLAVQSDIDAINSRLAYKDISSSIDVGETGCTKVAYVENGQVIVRITYPAGAKGDKRLSIDTAYTPRMTVYGSANGNDSDFGKLTTSWISPEGIIYLHATDAPATDMTATFTYPLKSS